jgi:hypothetical protein
MDLRATITPDNHVFRRPYAEAPLLLGSSLHDHLFNRPASEQAQTASLASLNAHIANQTSPQAPSAWPDGTRIQNPESKGRFKDRRRRLLHVAPTSSSESALQPSPPKKTLLNRHRLPPEENWANIFLDEETPPHNESSPMAGFSIINEPTPSLVPPDSPSPLS